MTPEQLRIFVAVAERGHVTRAAELLGMSQSAASAAIKALEQGSGVRLFNRVGRAIELSPAGRRFLPEAKAVLERIAAARHVLENASQTIAGSIAIAASQTIASYWLPRRLAAFQEEHPAVRLDVSIGNTRQVENKVLDGTADLGLVEGRTESDLLRRARVDVDRLMLVVARTHPDVAELSSGQPDIAKPALDRPRERVGHARGAAGSGAADGQFRSIRSAYFWCCRATRPSFRRSRPAPAPPSSPNSSSAGRWRRARCGTCRWRCRSATSP